MSQLTTTFESCAERVVSCPMVWLNGQCQAPPPTLLTSASWRSSLPPMILPPTFRGLTRLTPTPTCSRRLPSFLRFAKQSNFAGKQLSWNYNYGAFSNAMFGDTKVLLKNPELVSNTWLNFASAIWLFVTPQPPKPSMLAIVDGSWTPNPHDMRANRLSGFGATIMVINGGIECGRWPTNAAASSNRQRYYRQFAAKQGLHIDAADKKTMGCADMAPFDAKSSAQRALYWAP